jgi:REP element-mobilizing transposase RayT
MPRRLRFIPEGSLVEVTCRTIHGRFLLTPRPLVRRRTIGVLGRAQRLYPVRVHAFAFLSNHYHLLLTVESAERLARFMNYLNSNLAREIGRIAHWRERFWSGRYHAIVVSEEEAAQASRLRYVLSHGCKEGLVAAPTDWPGAHSAQALTSGTRMSGEWVDRTRAWRTRGRAPAVESAEFVEKEELALVPLPCWQNLPPHDYRERIEEVLSEIQSTSSRRLRDSGIEPLGAKWIVRQDPHQGPSRGPRRPTPLVHAATGGVRESFRMAYGLFTAAYRRAASQLRAGVRDAIFPAGSFPPSLPFFAPRPG